MIKAENITVQIPTSVKLVDSITLGIRPGVLTAIIGKNGAGKSTLLKALCGDIKLDQGKISIGDKYLASYDIKELAKIRAVVSQKSTLEFDFTVREVVALGRSPVSGFFNATNDRAIIDECLQKVDALHLSQQLFPTLSGGEQQRVHFARALAQIRDQIDQQKPSYLLLDEPLASLDVAHQHEMMHLLKQLTTNNVAVGIVLHDLNLAAQYADHVYLLKNGTTIAEGSPEQVFTEEIIFEAFDHPVSVIPHPKIRCPLIIASGF